MHGFPESVPISSPDSGILAPPPPRHPRGGRTGLCRDPRRFAVQGIGYDAALVSLDLAVLYLRQGRRAEVRRIAEEMTPLFQAQDVHREALAALILFQEAACQDRLTAERALEVAAYLRAARHEPGLRFAWNPGPAVPP
jgi:hypothetical protein